MVELATLQAISYIMGSLGVFVAAVYYVVTLRNSEKTRRIETTTNRLQLRSLDFYLTFHEVMTMNNWETIEEWSKKYGRDVNWEAYAKWNYIGSSFDHIGKLLKDKLVDEEQLFDLYPPPMAVRFWEAFEPVIKNMRIGIGYPDTWKNFEYLYNETKRRFPTIQPVKRNS